MAIKGLVTFTLFLSLANIVQSQSRLDMFLDTPKRIELPSDYLASQTVAQAHDFKIKFQVLNMRDYYGVSTEIIDRMFHITSFFYSMLIKVQDIPQNQTKFPKDVSDQKGYCFNQIVPQKYTQDGFSTKEQDLIIFTNIQDVTSNQIGAGACVVERRPLYGLFSLAHLRYNFLQDNANFHNNLVRIIHSILHILGFNTNFIVQASHTLISEIQNRQNSQTFYFQSASSNQRLLVKDVIGVNYGDLKHPIIKTARVKQAVRQIFGCSNTQQVGGAALQKVKDSNQNQYVRFHWHKQIYQDQFMVYVSFVDFIYKYSHILRQNQQLRMSKLSWAMLQDTGFYQYVEHSLIDNFKPRTLQSYYSQYLNPISKCQQHKDLYSQWIFQKMQHCNVYGTSRRNTYYVKSQMFPVLDNQTFQQNKCTKMSPYFRCIEIFRIQSYTKWHLPYQQCTYADCIKNNTIRILFNGVWKNVCTREQAGMDRTLGFRSNFTIHCPSDFDAFCNEKTCENWCSKQGICINGQCYYPQRPFQGRLKKQNLQHNFYPAFIDKATQKILMGKVCQRGCLQCQMAFDLTFHVCKVSKIHFDDQNPMFPLCNLAFETCLAIAKPVSPCFNSYFYSNGKCYRCDSSCTHCQQTFGSRQMISFCKNCQEGKFPFYEICKSCQVQNCMRCKENGSCQKCRLNYYLPIQENNTTRCLRCLSSCGICNPKNMTVCLGCGEGYFLENNQCKSCISFCRKCKNNSICNQCYKGFILRQNICVRPCELPCRQCVIGQPTKCLSCASFHDYNSTTYSCQDILIESTQNCPLGYYKTVSDLHSGNCMLIPINNCLIAIQGREVYNLSKAIPFCHMCKKGFFLSQQNKCQPCRQGCLYCFQADICDICSDGFSNPKNMDGSRNTVKCLKCEKNCLQCPASPDQCQLCQENYGLIGTSCHSINRVKVQLFFDIDYYVFLEQNKLEIIKSMMMKLIDQKSTIQIERVEKGSIKIFGIVSRIFQGQVAKDCLLSYNLTSKFSNSGVASEFPLIGASFINNIPECDDFIPTQEIQIIYFVSAGASILILVLVIIIVCLVRKLAIKEKIILKYEQIQSRPQYFSDSVIKIGF